MVPRNSCFAQFFYRVNSNKTIEAICGFCFVASQPAVGQAELRAWENAHVCNEEKQSSGTVASPSSGIRSAVPGKRLSRYAFLHMGRH